MACTPDVLKEIPLFGLLDDDERAILAAQVDLRQFEPRQRIYKRDESASGAFIMVHGSVAVTTIADDNQVVVLHTPSHGEAFGLAAMLSGTVHTTSATAIEQTQCIEIQPDDLVELIRRKPDAAVDLMGAMARQFHAAGPPAPQEQLPDLLNMDKPNPPGIAAKVFQQVPDHTPLHRFRQAGEDPRIQPVTTVSFNRAVSSGLKLRRSQGINSWRIRLRRKSVSRLDESSRGCRSCCRQ